jgi:sulfatase maturation enzyme AslB (radical SAM superfamily)
MTIKAALRGRAHRRLERSVRIEGDMVRLLLEDEISADPMEPPEGEALDYLLDVQMPCNMRCAGCEGRPDAVALTDEASRTLSDGVLAAARARGATSLSLALYGGEPLLDAERVLALSTRVRRGCEERGVTYAGHLITNGTLLSSVRPLRLVEAGFRAVQVTLEGVRCVHDARRRMLDGGGSWTHVVEGLKHALEGAAVVVRAPADGLSPVEELLDELEREGLLEGEQPLAVYVARAAPYTAQARALLKIGALLASA